MYVVSARMQGKRERPLFLFTIGIAYKGSLGERPNRYDSRGLIDIHVWCMRWDQSYDESTTRHPSVGHYPDRPDHRLSLRVGSIVTIKDQIASTASSKWRHHRSWSDRPDRHHTLKAGWSTEYLRYRFSGKTHWSPIMPRSGLSRM